MENLIEKYYKQEIKKIIDKSSEILEEEQYRRVIGYLIGYISSQLEPLVMPNEVVAGGNNELLKFLRWLYDQEELELTETGWYYKEDEEGTYELSNLEVLNKYYASQRKA